MKTKLCENCKHFRWKNLNGDCKKKHKPRFYMPKHPLDFEYGYKRKCKDFASPK